MLYIFPQRTLYAEAKFESTEDFSEVRDRLEVAERRERRLRKIMKTKGLEDVDEETGKDGGQAVGNVMSELYGAGVTKVA